jgi:hypothetical protein
MIHYTIYPHEWIFMDPYRPPERQIRDVSIGGVLMQVEVLKNGEARILRLLSPEPRHYLNPRFQPGNRINLIPTVQ